MVESHKKSTRSKSFHFRYLELCRTKNYPPLTDIKGRNNSAGVLEFFGDKFKIDDWLLIMEALFNDVTLHTIGIRLRKNAGQVFEHINSEKKARLFRSHPVIFTKYIFGNLIDSIGNCVSHSKNITTLALDGLPLTERYTVFIAKALSCNNTIRVLSFFRSAMGDVGADIICSTVKHLPNIESINLSRCQLSVKGAESVADMIKFQKIFRFSEGWSQSLRYREVDPDSIPGLREILISQNPCIGDGGLQHITEVLKEDAWIKMVDVSDCGLTDVGAKYVLDCLDLNKTITLFNIKQNRGISDHLLMGIMKQLGQDSDSEKSDGQPGHINVAKLNEQIKFLEEKVESEIFRRKQMEILNEKLHHQIQAVEKELTSKQDLQLPEGYTMIQRKTFQKIFNENESLKRVLSTMRANKKAAYTRKFVIRKARSETVSKVDKSVKQRKFSKSEHGITKKEATKKKSLGKPVVETSIGDTSRNFNDVEDYLSHFKGVDALKVFIRKKIASNRNPPSDEMTAQHVFMESKITNQC